MTKQEAVRLRRMAAWSGGLVPACECSPVELYDDGDVLRCDRCKKPVRERDEVQK
jgi:hypothetical protein